MKAAELIAEVERAGGELRLSGDRLHYRLPANVAPELLDQLRRFKREVVAALREAARCRNTCQEKDWVSIHAPDRPAVEAARASGKPDAWFESIEPDPVGDAVRRLLKPGEYRDDRGVIRTRIQ